MSQVLIKQETLKSENLSNFIVKGKRSRGHYFEIYNISESETSSCLSVLVYSIFRWPSACYAFF